METEWVDFLRAPGDRGHAVQIYANVDEVAESVAAFLATGLAAGEPALVIARPDHQVTFARVLEATGWDSGRLTGRQLLTTLDAEETLEALLAGDGISTTAFQDVVGTVIDRLASGRRVRVFGEMVDILLARGRPELASALEDRWNELATTRRLALLCGYRLDVFDAHAQAWTLPAVCRAHTHVMPAYDMARLDRAVYDALDEVLGSASARMVHGMVRDDAAEQSAPISEQTLMWISERMPRHAPRVLSVARANYERAAA